MFAEHYLLHFYVVYPTAFCFASLFLTLLVFVYLYCFYRLSFLRFDQLQWHIQLLLVCRFTPLVVLLWGSKYSMDKPRLLSFLLR